MNLTNLFNFEYLMQNIKKSKMNILLFLLVVPLFTALTLIIAGSSTYAIEFWELGLANIIFMYITPFMLSFCLFGYVFKKKEIDFVGSMPISRKSIYVTNTIGGIVLIILSQFITLLVSLLLGTITDVIVFPAMVWDIFLYQTLAYIFVFAISNLAMSVSGNIITQIVTTILILCVVPACTFYFDAWNGGRYDLMDGEYVVNDNYTIRMMRNYTAPCSPLAAVVDYNWEYGATTISCVKMAVLSVAYIAIGYIMFEKKKLENAGESFEKNNTHFIVKALTLIPFGMIMWPCVDEEEWGIALFLLGVIAVYYLIYDLITNKRNKFWKNMSVMLMSIVIATAGSALVAKLGEEVRFEIDLENVKSITINSFRYEIDALDYTIEDEALIEEILFGATEEYRYYYTDIEEKNAGARVVATLNMKNGSKKRATFRLTSKLTDEILKSLNTEEYMVENLDYNDSFEFSKEEEKKLHELINEFISGDGLYKIYNLRNDYSRGNQQIKTYKYVNHRVRSVAIPIGITKEVFEIVTSAENREVIDYVRKRKNTDINMYVYQSNAINYDGNCPMALKEFIINSKDMICDIDKEFYAIAIDGNYFYTNETTKVTELIKQSSEYKEYYERRYNDDYNYDKYYWDDIGVNTTVSEPQPIPEAAEVTSFPETTSSTIVESL